MPLESYTSHPLSAIILAHESISQPPVTYLIAGSWLYNIDLGAGNSQSQNYIDDNLVCAMNQPQMRVREYILKQIAEKF